MRKSRGNTLIELPVMRKRRGFTLIELLVVIAIIAILATVVVVNYRSARAKARDSQMISDSQKIATALDLFESDKNHYPYSADAGFAPQTGSECVHQNNSSQWNSLGTLLKSYLSNFPASVEASSLTYIRYCNASSAIGASGKTINNFQILTSLETESGNGASFTGTNWDNNAIYDSNKFYIIQR